jgi:glutamate racemase
MIGIFDSWSGGLTFLAAMKHRFPEWSYLYYADYEHCPFGERPPEEIQALTIAGVQKLFDAGADIVILACNTASAWTLRKLQTEIFPDKKILGVTIPGAEKVVELGYKYVTVFATQQTVKSRAYAQRARILDAEISVQEIALSGDLVRDIESLLPVHHCQNVEDFQELMKLYAADGWDCADERWQQLTDTYFSPIRSLIDNQSQAIILGCTHYSYLRKPLQLLFPEMPLIDPSEESALRLANYLLQKPDILLQIQKTGEIKFL